MWMVFRIALGLILILWVRSLAGKVKAFSELQLATSKALGEMARAVKAYEGKLRELDRAVRGLKARENSGRMSRN